MWIKGKNYMYVVLCISILCNLLGYLPDCLFVRFFALSQINNRQSWKQREKNGNDWQHNITTIVNLKIKIFYVYLRKDVLLNNIYNLCY